MTPQELNRDIKRLRKYVKEQIPFSDDEYVKKELSRLYYADDKFQYMNKESVITLLRLNVRFRAIPLHMFGIMVDI